MAITTILLLFFSSMKFSFMVQVVKATPTPHLGHDLKILQASIVEAINSDATVGWIADMSPRFSDYTVGQFKYLLGEKPMPKDALEKIPVISHPKNQNLPRHFDARTAWPQCSTIGRILGNLHPTYQGHCGACWAFGAAESLSDRFCVQFGMNISLSVNDLLSCCGFMCGNCDGGYSFGAWRYFVHHGVVTDDCDPYFDNTGCSHPGCEPRYPTPKCERKCVKDNLHWRKSKHFSTRAYRVSADPYSIMAEVHINGPVGVSFTVHEDFAHYKSGVYKYRTGRVMGGHSVKLIGWGTTEDGEDYWLLANQWNKSWGDDGYFKMRRGTNECGIERNVNAGTPSSRNLIHESSNADTSIGAKSI